MGNLMKIIGGLGLVYSAFKIWHTNKLKRMKLSKNFTLGELIRTSAPFDNVPNSTEIKNLQYITDKVLQPLRDYFKTPIKITSGFRSPLVNRYIGGSSTSQHTTGNAADFTVTGLTPKEVTKAVKMLGLPFDQLIDERKINKDGSISSWVHISLKKANNRNEHLIARNNEAEGKMNYFKA